MTHFKREADRQALGLDIYAAKGNFAECFGYEWGDPKNPAWTWGAQILEGFLFSYLGSDKTVMEIGAGGGRWSQFIIPKCKRALLVDGTPASEAATRGHFGAMLEGKSVDFLVSPDGKLPKVRKASVDFVFSFDTFVHFDEDLFFEYLRTIARVLKPGGVLSLHYSCDANHEKASKFFRYYADSDVLSYLANLGMEPLGEPLRIHSNIMRCFRKSA